MQTETENICPFCGVEFEHGATACPSCDLPLITPDRIASVNARARAGERVGTLAVAGRPRPEYSAGDLRRAALAMNQAEADMLEDMLRSEGIPCVVRRSQRADLPDFGASGQREILVPEGGLAAARELLNVDSQQPAAGYGSAVPVAAFVVAGIVLAILAIVIFLAFA